MRQSDDCQAVDALRQKAVAIRSLGWPGYCGTTGSDEAGCSDRRRKGTWEGVRQLNHCLDHCRNCSRCHYVSFSASHGDCSWFRACDTDKLKTALSRAHTTYRVRTANGALTSLDVGTPGPSIDKQIKQHRCVEQMRSAAEQYRESGLGHRISHVCFGMQSAQEVERAAHLQVISGITPPDAKPQCVT